jgi:hypothetical protein
MARGPDFGGRCGWSVSARFVLPCRPKGPWPPPRRRGVRRTATRRPGTSGRRHRKGGTHVEHPEAARAGFGFAREGLSRERRPHPPRRERENCAAARAATSSAPCDRRREAETQHAGVRGRHKAEPQSAIARQREAQNAGYPLLPEVLHPIWLGSSLYWPMPLILRLTKARIQHDHRSQSNCVAYDRNALSHA